MKNRMQLTFRCHPIINELITKTVIAIDNYNNTLKEYESIHAASKDIRINSGIIIYSCTNMHKPKKRYIFCYKKNHSKKKYINILYRRDGSKIFTKQN